MYLILYVIVYIIQISQKSQISRLGCCMDCALLLQKLAYFTWDPPSDLFTVPFLDRPIKFYGAFFVLGFVIGYFIMVSMLKRKLHHTAKPIKKDKATLSEVSVRLTDKLIWFTVGGTIIGARLGHVFFYEWARYKDHLGDIFKVWEGGLASHGGAIGVFIALILYKRFVLKDYPEITFIRLMDMVVIPTALVGCCIRIGNVFNQEILGTETTLPWAILFAHPADGSAPVPRHPVQLYEAIAYLATFFFLYYLWKARSATLKPGVLSGLFFIFVFGSRFFLEFFKTTQGVMVEGSPLQTGQILSIPFVLVGVILLVFGGRLEHRQKS